MPDIEEIMRQMGELPSEQKRPVQRVEVLKVPIHLGMRISLITKIIEGEGRNQRTIFIAKLPDGGTAPIIQHYEGGRMKLDLRALPIIHNKQMVNLITGLGIVAECKKGAVDFLRQELHHSFDMPARYRPRAQKPLAAGKLTRKLP